MAFNMVNVLGQTKPIKSILKSSTSFESKDSSNSSHANLHHMSQKSLSEDNHSSQPARKAAKFDEMNILETLHPPDKDYGHMKIEEPKTPFNYYEEGEDTEGQCHGLDEDDVARRLAGDSSATLKVHQLLSDDEEEDEEPEGEECKEKRKHFDAKRKAHYNEYYAVKLARKLMEEELVEDEEEAETAPKSTDEEMRDLEVEEPQ